jgi:hypothetical protein
MAWGGNGSRWAYTARRGDQCVAVIDGKESPPFERMLDGDSDYTGSPIFSSDGKHVTYMASRGGKRFMVVDGKEGPAHAVTFLARYNFSPDGNRIAYVAWDTRNQLEKFVVDGKEGPVEKMIFEPTPIFSPDSKRVAYVAQREKSWLVNCDGVDGEPYFLIKPHTLRFSADSKHFSYEAAELLENVVVLDGDPGPVYNDIIALAAKPEAEAEFLAVKDEVLYRVSYKARK